MLMLSDSIPGSYVMFQQNGESNAKYMFARVEIPNNLPETPVLLSPPNGSTLQPRNPNLKWNPANYAVTYRVQLSLNSNFTSIILDSANIIQTNLQLPPNFLSTGVQVYWRVNASNTNGAGPYSNIWNFTTATIPFYSISGLIRYKDNNQAVTGGYVKALKLDTTNLQIITLDSAVIQADGSYTLGSVRSETDVLISPYPNSTPPNDNFVPTYYPSEILWERAARLNVNTNLSNINVNVYRVAEAFGYYAFEGNVFRNIYPGTQLNDAVIYAKKDTSFYRFAISNSSGHYRLSYLAPATYKLFISRLGYKSDSTIVTIVIGLYENQKNFILNPYYVGIKKSENVIPASFNLYQNYPNPFNPVTRIKFDVPKMSNVILRIYDIAGREITKLINSKFQPGEYEISWDGTNFASGLYFIKMETNTFTSVKKMILIK
jgi:hypothetical protein